MLFKSPWFNSWPSLGNIQSIEVPSFTEIQEEIKAKHQKLLMTDPERITGICEAWSTESLGQWWNKPRENAGYHVWLTRWSGSDHGQTEIIDIGRYGWNRPAIRRLLYHLRTGSRRSIRSSKCGAVRSNGWMLCWACGSRHRCSRDHTKSRKVNDPIEDLSA